MNYLSTFRIYLLPFAITIGICFVLMLTLMFLKCIRDYRRSRRHRLSSRALKKLPIHKFKKGDPYECCAVCLEDYVDNDKLRAYHSKCIDPWLTKNRRVCPVCKRKVITGDERPSDLDSDSEDETAPLINSEGGTQGGTFAQQRENPFQEAERQADLRRQEEMARPSDGRAYNRLDETDSDSENETQTQNRGTGLLCLNETIAAERADSSDASDCASTTSECEEKRGASTFAAPATTTTTTTFTTLENDHAEDVEVKSGQKQSPPHNNYVV
ncbi:E3 ubiquitin-protein ligase RNF13 [Armadillidium vulgare]|nr:E3 ubiquitin-protein ligase RNF13 [Armadillidium vulgare]